MGRDRSNSPNRGNQAGKLLKKFIFLLNYKFLDFQSSGLFIFFEFYKKFN